MLPAIARRESLHVDLRGDNTGRMPDAGPLGEARDLWRALNEHVPDLVLQVRPDGTIFFANAARRADAP